MKKILVVTILSSLIANYSLPVFANSMETENKPDAVVNTENPSITEKDKKKSTFWEKIKFPKKNKNTNVSFVVEDIQNNEKSRVEIKTIAQVQEDLANSSRKERRQAKNAEEKMTIQERQEALADKISSDILNEEILDSTTIKGGVEENVIVSVDDCVKLGLYNNPTIRYAISNSDIYKSKIAQAWSNYFPQFSLGTSYAKNKMLATNFKFPKMKYDLWNAMAVEGSLLLFDFGKTNQKVKIAKRTHEATISDIQTAINDTVYSVKSAYYQYLYMLRQQQVLQSTVDKFNTHYLEAKAAYEVGAKSKIDVITAEYNLSNAKLDLIKAKNQVESAKAQLNNTMGLPTYSSYSVTDQMDIENYDLNFDNLIEEAYNLRPELQSVAKKTEASRVMITSSKLAFMPDLRGFGSYTLGGIHYADNYGYQAGIRLAYPTSNFMLLKKQVDEAKATHERDLAELDKKKNDVFLDVKTAYIEYINARDSLPVAHQAMNEAQLQYEIAAGRYRTGFGDAIELKDAEITYRNAQLNYYNALMQYNISVAGVERMVGMPVKSVSTQTELDIPLDVNAEEISL